MACAAEDRALARCVAGVALHTLPALTARSTALPTAASSASGTVTTTSDGSCGDLDSMVALLTGASPPEVRTWIGVHRPARRRATGASLDVTRSQAW